MAVHVGKTLAIESADAASLKSGDARLSMKKDGSVQLQGRDIALNASGRLEAKASGNVTIKGSKVLQI